jgi:long-chain acyl-CoA synthetase
MLCADGYEGYGLTECTAVGTITRKRVDIPGKVGVISPSLEMKLIDVPDMQYYSTDKPYPRGEICLRGPSIFLGYYMNEDLTEEALHDGWFHTGDIGLVDSDGRLGIIDRKKAIFKLSQGEYTSPEYIESILLRSPLIAQIWVTGSPLTPFPVAVVIPDEYALAAWARSNNISGSIRELCSKTEVYALYLKELSMYGRHGTKELNGFEVPQRIHLHWEPFSQENGLMTPTFKLKRIQLAIKYSNVISKMVNSLDTA